MMRRCLTAIALVALCLPSWGAWYNASWSHRASVTINAASVDEAVDWIYVPFSSFDTTWWGNVNSTDGRDIRVTQSDGTTELARYILPSFTDSGTSGTGGMFVDVSGYISASADKDIHVYVGNAGASDYGPTDTYGRNNVFDANTVAVYLPGETTTDLTGGGLDLTAVNTPGTAASDYEGITAATYNGSTQYHYYEGALPVTTWPVTVEALAETTSTGLDQVVLSLTYSATNNDRGEVIFAGGTGSGTVQGIMRGLAGSSSTASTSTTYSANTSCHIVATRDADTGTTYSYIDGGSSGSNATSILAAAFDRISIGTIYINAGAFAKLSGECSLAVVYDVVRSANYISTRHNNFSAPGTFLTHGSSEAAPSAGGQTDWVEFASAATTAGGGTVNWTNASNALTSLASAATADLGADVTSYALQLTNASAGLSSVSGTIDGIEIRVEATGEDDGTKELEDITVQLIIGGSQTGDNKAVTGTDWGDSAIETRDYGGAADDWTTSATDSQVKATNFGVALQFKNFGTVDALMSVYRVRVRVTYGGYTPTVPGSGFFQVLN